MRTTIAVDDRLMTEAQAVLGMDTKLEAVEEALRRVVQLQRQEGLLSLRGIGWEGDLDAMRTD